MSAVEEHVFEVEEESLEEIFPAASETLELSGLRRIETPEELDFAEIDPEETLPYARDVKRVSSVPPPLPMATRYSLSSAVAVGVGVALLFCAAYAAFATESPQEIDTPVQLDEVVIHAAR